MVQLQAAECVAARVVCMQIAADNAVFGQTGPKVGSFDAGYGSTHMARLVGQKKAREIWFLARLYGAQEAQQMGLINKVSSIGPVSCERTSQACVQRAAA